MSIKHCTNLLLKLGVSSYRASVPIRSQPIHTTCRRLDLNEFFEDPKNLGKEEIKCGRSWRLGELRLKSNEDLHKIWYVLLKEKNMLLTMEHYCKENWVLFPNPERIDKVEESMNNIETVVRERNKAYYELETGETGERPGKVIYDKIGMKHWRNLTQHYVPRWLNKAWNDQNLMNFDNQECEQFFKLFREKNQRELRFQNRMNKRYVRGLLRRFPNMDLEHLKELYPYYRLEQELEEPWTQGHFEKRSDAKKN